MPYEKLPIGGAHREILSWANHEFSIEEQSMLRNVSRLPCLFKHVALMPDAHLGKGSMVGSVIATKEAVIPATVGVDIGCGMMAVKTPFKSGILDGKLKDLRLAIEEAIPAGFNEYKESVDESSYWNGWNDFSELHPGVHDRKAKAMKQLGTLGGGNHFIEVCLDTDNLIWLMLHSGSRNIGKELAYLNIRRRREQAGMKRMRIYMRDNFCCQYCGEKKGVDELTLDHIFPRSRGGDNSPVNIVTACLQCNNRKIDRTPEEARMPLLTSQTALRVKLERVVLCHYAEARAEWRKYLFMDMHDDRNVMDKVHNEQKRRA